MNLTSYTIYNIEGRVILNKPLEQGTNNVSITIEKLESGTYIIEVESDDAKARKIFMKE